MKKMFSICIITLILFTIFLAPVFVQAGEEDPDVYFLKVDLSKGTKYQCLLHETKLSQVSNTKDGKTELADRIYTGRKMILDLDVSKNIDADKGIAKVTYVEDSIYTDTIDDDEIVFVSVMNFHKHPDSWTRNIS